MRTFVFLVYVCALLFKENQWAHQPVKQQVGQGLARYEQQELLCCTITCIRDECCACMNVHDRFCKLTYTSVMCAFICSVRACLRSHVRMCIVPLRACLYVVHLPCVCKPILTCACNIQLRALVREAHLPGSDGRLNPSSGSLVVLPACARPGLPLPFQPALPVWCIIMRCRLIKERVHE